MSLPEPAQDATVVVTGASSGIGAELARALARRGHGLTLVARRAERLTALADELRSRHGVAAAVHSCDLGDADARAELVAELRRGPWVAGLCNNAGFGSIGLFHELPVDHEADQVRLNVCAGHELTGAVLPEMVRRGAGAILNTASIAAAQPIPKMATYAATKAFVLAFSEAINEELSATGVSVTALCPGPVDTEFNQSAGVERSGGPSMAGILRVSAADVAEEGVRGMVEGRRTVTPGLGAKALATTGRYSPRAFLLPLGKRVGMERILE